MHAIVWMVFGGFIMFKHILLPTDGSEAALRAITQGAELARSIGAEVTVMTCVEHFPAGIMGSGYRPGAKQEDEPGHQIALERLAQAERILQESGVKFQRIVLRDQAAYRGILEAARMCGADLIVMGTRGLGLMDRLFIGSQTQRVLARTSLPVLTMH